MNTRAIEEPVDALVGAIREEHSSLSINPDHVFEEDLRSANPGLHHLYFKYALVNLRKIDHCIQTLSACANTSLSAMLLAMQEQREKLVQSDAAYAEAEIQLRELKLTQATQIVSIETDETVG